jgi:aerobic-type carbon monoxide dehydrogenase small subunit (CoxS/CutS family)
MPSVSFTLNGKPTTVDTDDTRRLLWVLRDDFALTGTKFGCNIGSCGSCTVIVNGEATRACTTTLKSVAGKKVTTIEGLATGDTLAPVQQAFLEHLGFQCGYCTSGQIMNAHALLEHNPKPTRDQIVQGMERNYCRCAAHTRIIEAIEAASKMTATAGSGDDR